LMGKMAADRLKDPAGKIGNVNERIERANDPLGKVNERIAKASDPLGMLNRNLEQLEELAKGGEPKK
jgi:hypothetical protein